MLILATRMLSKPTSTKSQLGSEEALAMPAVSWRFLKCSKPIDIVGLESKQQQAAWLARICRLPFPKHNEWVRSLEEVIKVINGQRSRTADELYLQKRRGSVGNCCRPRTAAPGQRLRGKSAGCGSTAAAAQEDPMNCAAATAAAACCRRGEGHMPGRVKERTDTGRGGSLGVKATR